MIADLPNGGTTPLRGDRVKGGDVPADCNCREGPVVFMTDSQEVQQVGPGEILYAPLASTRLRVLLPAAELARHRKVLLAPRNAMLSEQVEARRSAAVVIAKLPLGRIAKMDFAALDRLDEWMNKARRETRLFADLCDDYAALAATLNAPILAEYQRLLVQNCSIAVPTQAFATKLQTSGAGQVVVIEDPYESQSARPPRQFSGPIPRLFWFGNLAAPNAPLLRTLAKTLASKLSPQAASLEIVAASDAAPIVEKIRREAAAENPGFSVTFTKWSLSSVAKGLERTDFVLLPHDLNKPWTHVMSHNRLVEAIRAGRFAIASPIPAYQELAAYAWLGDSLADGIRWALEHPSEVAERLLAGQAYVESRFSPATIGDKWAHALLSG